MTDALYGALLDRLGGAAQPEVNADAVTRALLAELGDDDPRTRIVAAWLAQRQAAQAREPPVQVIDQEPEAVAFEWAPRTLHDVEVDEARQPYERLSRMVNRMSTELQELRVHNDAAAAALGACYLCWGESASCVVCGGLGQAGWLPPHAELYERLVAPVARRLAHRSATESAHVSAGDAVERLPRSSATTRRHS